jgi:hypothetical protein
MLAFGVNDSEIAAMMFEFPLLQGAVTNRDSFGNSALHASRVNQQNALAVAL